MKQKLYYNVIRYFALAAVIFGIIITSISCGNQTNGLGNNEATSLSESSSPSTTLPDLYPNVPDNLNYEGETITIFSNNYNDYFISLVENQNGEILNDSRYHMQQYTEEKLNVILNEIEYSAGDLGNAVNNMVNAGDTGCDIACNMARFSVELMTKGIAYDMAKLDYLDFESAYWMPNINSSVSIGDSVYYAATGFNLAVYAYTSCTLFNYGLATSLSLDPKLLYEDVYNQNWTYDKMNAYMALATSDLNGDGAMDENDRWGLTAYDWNTFASSVYVSSNTVTVDKSNENGLIMTWDSERFSNAMEIAYKMYHGNDAYTSNKRNDPSAFVNGNALFLNGFFYTLNMLTEMTDDFGVLPCPKYDEKQDDYINLTTDSIFAVIPFSAKDANQSAAVLEVMSYAGYSNVLPAYTETTLQYKKTRDADSAEIIRLCLATAKIDLGTVYASSYCGWDALHNNIMVKNDFTLSSYIASQKAANQQLQEVIDAARIK